MELLYGWKGNIYASGNFFLFREPLTDFLVVYSDYLSIVPSHLTIFSCPSSVMLPPLCVVVGVSHVYFINVVLDQTFLQHYS